MSKFEGKIAIMGGGSWATALAHLFLHNCERILWYMRRDDRIDEFRATRHNPAYLSDIEFPVERITFSSDINYVCREADAIVLVMPSPYFKAHTAKLTADISDKIIVTAVKGIVPGDNELVTDYMHRCFGVSHDRTLVVSGPTHAEEIALNRPSYLTVGCRDTVLAEQFAGSLSSQSLHTILSNDVEGIEYAGVLKNVYAIAAGIVHGMKMGDNFLAMLVSNAVREMQRFIDTLYPDIKRNICDSVYLGDLLVTSYSRFSRNHNFGSMIGKGYSVTAARMEMEQTAEGYYGTNCIHEINNLWHVEMPILDCVYDILYRRKSPDRALRALASSLR